MATKGQEVVDIFSEWLPTWQPLLSSPEGAQWYLLNPKKVSVYKQQVLYNYFYMAMTLKDHGPILSYIPDVKHVAKYSHIAQLGLCDYGKNHNHDYFGQ